MTNPLQDMAKQTPTRAPVDTESTQDPMPAAPVLAGSHALQREALALAAQLGTTQEALAGYCGVSRSAICRWASNDRSMPAPLLARVVALLPWLVVHCGFQIAVARDAAGAADLVTLERDVDRLVGVALGDARLAADVERAWSDIYATVASPAGRAALAQITAAHMLKRPVGAA